MSAPFSPEECRRLAREMWHGVRLPTDRMQNLCKSIIPACRKWRSGDPFYTLDSHTVAIHLGVPHETASAIITFNCPHAVQTAPSTWKFGCCSGCGFSLCPPGCKMYGKQPRGLSSNRRDDDDYDVLSAAVRTGSAWAAWTFSESSAPSRDSDDDSSGGNRDSGGGSSDSGGGYGSSDNGSSNPSSGDTGSSSYE